MVSRWSSIFTDVTPRGVIGLGLLLFRYVKLRTVREVTTPDEFQTGRRLSILSMQNYEQWSQ